MLRRPLLLLILVLALAGAALAGCGGSDSSDDSGGAAATTPATPETTTGGEASGGAPASGAAAVSMKNIQFVPGDVTVKAGQKITWSNEDSVAHTVTSADDGKTFDSGTVDSGSTFEFTPEKAGTIDYVCLIHPNQKGKITVTQ